MKQSLIGSGHTGRSWVPADARTLPTPEQPLRVAAFDRLFGEALVESEMVVDAGEPPESLALGGGKGPARRVRELVDAETARCSFFTFHVGEQSRRASDGNGRIRGLVRVDVTVPAARREVLEALVGRARDRAGLPTTSADAD